MDDSDYADSDYEYDDDDGEPMSEDEGGDDYGFEPSADHMTSSQKAPYSVLNKEELRAQRQKAIDAVTSVLGIPDEEAARVLRKYKWDVSRVHEEWFADTDAVRESVGLLDEVPSTSQGKQEATCSICFDNFRSKDMLSASCGHLFCKDCYKGYLNEHISSGPACLDLRCPIPGCKACVPVEIVHKVCAKEMVAKYEEFALRSFIDDNRKVSWCTGGGCENAIYCRVDRGSEDALDVICNCGASFCFNCKEEAHRPVQCDTVKKWITKNSAESENLNWIMANTKPCPKCHRPIEKNQGCMHMTCSQCRFEFCWLCSGAWAEHGERTGGYYACNRYDSAKRKGDYDDETKRRENAKQSLERYMHYYERWDAHERARQAARESKEAISQTEMERLSDLSKTPTSQLRYIPDAWDQIIECRRILKWTYAYGYYHFMEDTPEADRQRTFFEFLQGDAERSLDNLHEMAEKKLKDLVGDPAQAYVAPSSPPRDEASFSEFRKKLIGLTDVTKGFFDKLVKQLETGFENLERIYSGERDVMAAAAASGAGGAGPSTSNGAAAAADERSALEVRGKGRRGKRGRTGAASVDEEIDMMAEQGFWSCPHCTFANDNMQATQCSMCEQPRNGAAR